MTCATSARYVKSRSADNLVEAAPYGVTAASLLLALRAALCLWRFRVDSLKR